MAIGKELAAPSRLTELESLVSSVQKRIEDLGGSDGLNFPPNYSVGNAIRSAWLAIQETKDMNGRRAIEVCTRESICNALFNTVVQGLIPAKKQVYYIVYGDQLQATRSYFGSMAAAKRLSSVNDIYADVVYKDDVFKVSKQHGSWHIDEHQSGFENIDLENIVAAYCVIEKADGSEYVEIMNMKQIQQAWNRSRSKQTVHKEFPDQMAMKTVINRACKFFINTSDDSDILVEAFNATGDVERAEEPPVIRRDNRIDALNAELSGQVTPAVKLPESREERPEEKLPQREAEETGVIRGRGNMGREDQDGQVRLDG